MTKVIAIANQKGGVGKTSTTVNLGAGLVRQGYDVLLIDLDSQANLTMALGFQNPDDMGFTVSNVLYKAVHEEMYETITFRRNTVEKYFPAGTSGKEIERIIIRLLENYSRQREAKKSYDHER